MKFIKIIKRSNWENVKQSFFEPINNKEFIKSNYQYFQLITDIVDDLDLNVRIWE